MANSPVDKSEEFIKSGMTLITDPAADKLLEIAAKRSKNKILTDMLSQAEWDDGFIGKWDK